MISAWYFAEEIKSVDNFKFSAPRRALIQIAASAYILSHPEIRKKVRDWSLFRWQNPIAAVDAKRVTAYKPVMQFANDLVADMRADGATIFG